MTNKNKTATNIHQPNRKLAMTATNTNNNNYNHYIHIFFALFLVYFSNLYIEKIIFMYI